MPQTGIEPVREYKSRRILSPVRLPVPPHLHLFELTIIILLRDDYNCQDILQKKFKNIKNI